MIPVPVWSNGQFVIALASFAALFILVLLLLLGLFPGFRRWVGRHGAVKGTLIIAVPLLMVSSLFAIAILATAWTAYEVATAPESARHVTLDHDTKVDEFDLPAETRIDLYDAYSINRHNIKKAGFPHPVTIHGIPSTALSSDAYGFEITPVHDETVDGWLCQARQPIRFTQIDMDNKPVAPYLTRCTLAEGNTAGKLAIPPGSSLQEALGELDHPHAVDIGIPGKITFGDLDAPLRHVCLRVAGPTHDPIWIGEATLAHPLRVGTVTLPAGIAVMWSPDDTDTRQRWSADRKTMYLGPWTFMLWQFSGSETLGPCI